MSKIDWNEIHAMRTPPPQGDLPPIIPAPSTHPESGAGSVAMEGQQEANPEVDMDALRDVLDHCWAQRDGDIMNGETPERVKMWERRVRAVVDALEALASVDRPHPDAQPLDVQPERESAIAMLREYASLVSINRETGDDAATDRLNALEPELAALLAAAAYLATKDAAP